MPQQDIPVPQKNAAPQKKRMALIIGGVILLLLIIWLASGYNQLVKRQENVERMWSDVQNSYQRRISLIPNLVRVVQGMSDFEQTTLVQVTEARTKAQSGLTVTANDTTDFKRQLALQDSLATAINRVIARIEDYPELRGTEAYLGLQRQLEGTETRIKVARNDFNAAVADYNRSVRGFPGGFPAMLFGFKTRDGFSASAGADKPVEVKF